MEAACRHGRRRSAATAALDALLILVGVAWVAAVISGMWLRGDVVRLAAVWTAIVVVSARLVLALRTMRRTMRADLATAQAVAAHGAPLRRPLPSDAEDPARLRADRLLRHEIVAAIELGEALAERDAPPEQDEVGADPSEDPPEDATASRVRAAAVGSEVLARRYVQDVERRVDGPTIDPKWALPHARLRARVLGLIALVGVAFGSLLASSTFAHGVGLLVAGVDGTPPVPPEPVWSSLTLQLDYPVYTRRPRRVVPNPSGALRVPAGTEVTVMLTARRPAAAGRLVVNYDADELATAPPPEIIDLEPHVSEEPEPAVAEPGGKAQASEDANAASPSAEGMKWRGTFTARGSGTWTLVLLDDEEDDPGDAARRSAALPLSQEPDRPPEIELAPLPRERREVRESDSVDLRFTARDDFGLSRAQLVYQLPDGTAHRLAIKPPVKTRRTWRGHYTWDISQIPIAERSEVLYWIEVRDNDPGLGLVPLADPPGKTTRSATMRLVVRDDEAEHAANILKLREIRNFAVDLLALRMLTRAFETEEEATAIGRAHPGLAVQAAMARDLLARSAELLAHVAAAIDALSMDSLAHERDVATLSAVHKRLAELHRTELSLHEAMPPRSEIERPDDAARALVALEPHNAEELTQLEDEIIRLDDLVQGQILERLEGLVARLEATQRKLVDLLEQLAAGDESVRSQIEQLEQRRREDLRRIAEARAMLSQEVEEEFMNVDAFEALQKLEQEGLQDMLERGDVDQALQRAQQQLGEIQGVRDQVQQRLGESGPGPELSEEEKKRMQLLRELSRMQDDEGSLRTRSKNLHERWREAVSEQGSEQADREAAGERADALGEALEEVNDARLGREGRRGLMDAQDAAERLSELSKDEETSALDLAEAAEALEQALEQAVAGSEGSEAEGKAVRQAQRRAQSLRERLMKPLPSPGDVLPAEDQKELGELEAQQRGLDKRARELLDDPLSDLLPGEGRQAMRRARRRMEGSADRLGAQRPGQAVPGQQSAWNALQEAIDSLRQGSPPPPSASSGDASTEAERDRSLRDELMDAMREQPPEGFAEPVERYYEELLR